MNHLCKYDGRTFTLVEERELVISRDDFLDAIEALWPVAKFENSEDLLRVKVWSTVSSAFLSRPRYIFELSTR